MAQLEGFQFKVQHEADAPKDPQSKSSAIDPGTRSMPLHLRCAKERAAVFFEHADEVLSLAFGPDGRTIVAGGEDATLVLWDMETRTKLMQATLCTSIASVAYAPNGKYVAAGDTNSFVTLWSTGTREQLGSVEVEHDLLTLAIASEPYELLAVGTTAKKVMLLSIPGLEEIADLRHDGHVRSLAFSPDGAMLAGGGGTDEMHGLMTRKNKDHAMKTVIWHVSGDGEDCKYLGMIMFDDIVHATAFSPSGEILAVGGETCMIAILLVQRDFEKSSELKCPAGVRCLAWSPDSSFLASGGEDKQISLWDATKGTLIFRLPKARDWLCSIAFSADTSWLACCGYGHNTVTLHPIKVIMDDELSQVSDGISVGPSIRISISEQPTESKSHGYIVDMGTASTGFEFYVGRGGQAAGDDGSCLFAKVAEKRSAAASLLGMKKTPVQMKLSEDREAAWLAHDDEVLQLAFSPDGSSLVAAGEDAKVVLWDVASGTRRMEARMTGGVTAVAYAPSGQYIAAGDLESCVTVWHMGTREEVGTTSVEGKLLTIALGSKPDDLLAVGTTGKQVLLLSIPELEEVAVLRHDGHVHSLAFSPDGSKLAGGGGTDETHGLITNKAQNQEMKTVVWHVSSNGEHCKYLGSILFTDIVHATAFSPTGKLLAVGSENCMIEILLVERNFDKVSELLSTAGIRCLAWSPDSRFLASGGESMQISVWDLTKQCLVFQLPRAKDWHCSVAFSSDGLWLASCGYGSKYVSLQPVETFCDAEEEGDETCSDSDSDDNTESAAFQVNVTSAHGGRRSSLVSPASLETLKTAGTVKLDSLQGREPPAPGGMQLMLPRGDAGARRPSVVDMGGIAEGFQFKVKQVCDKPAGGADRPLQLEDDQTSFADLVLGVKVRPMKIRHVETREAVPLEHDDEVMGLAFGPDGRTLVAAGEDATLVVWDIEKRSRKIETKMDGGIVAVAYAPNGMYVAAGNASSKVLVWDIAGGKEAGITTVEGDVLAVALASEPDSLLAVGSSSLTVKLLAVPGLEVIAELRHEGHVRSLAFGPGGLLAGGGGTDDTHGLMTNKGAEHEMKTVIWNVSADGDSCKYLGSILFDDIVHATTFSPSGRLLAVGGENCMIALLLVDRDFEKVKELPCSAGVRCLGWSSDSHFLASGGEDMQVTVWDTIAETVVFQLPKAKDWLCGVGFSADGSWLASCGFGSSSVLLHPVEIFEGAAAAAPQGGSQQEEDAGSEPSEAEAAGPSLVIPSLPVAVEVAGPTPLISCSADPGQPAAPGPSVAAVNLKIDVPSFEGKKPSGLVTPMNGQNLKSMGTVKIQRSASPQQQQQQPEQQPQQRQQEAGDSDAAVSVAVLGGQSPGSPMVGIGGAPGLGVPLNMQPLKSMGTIKVNTSRNPSAAAPGPPNLRLPGTMQRRPSKLVAMGDASEGFHLKIERVAVGVSPKDEGRDHQTKRKERKSVTALVLGVKSTPVQLQRSEDRDQIRLKHDDEILGLAFSPDGRRLVAAGEDAKVTLWDIRKQTKEMEEAMDNSVIAVDYAPSGDHVAAVDANSCITLWYTSTYQKLGSLQAEPDVLSLSLCSNPDELLAVGTTTKKVVLYSIPDFTNIAELRHDGHVHGLSFSLDGGMLAGGGGTDNMHGLMTNKTQDAEMKTVIWRVSADPDKCKYLGSVLFNDIIHAAAFSPSNKMLAVGGENRVISLLLVDRDFKKASQLRCVAGVTCVTWSSDSRFLASGGEDMQISVWDIVTETVVLQFPKVDDWYCRIAFSPDNLWLATCRYGISEAILFPVELVGDTDGDGSSDSDEDEDCVSPTLSVPLSPTLSVKANRFERLSIQSGTSITTPKKGCFLQDATPKDSGRRGKLIAPKMRDSLKTAGTVKFKAKPRQGPGGPAQGGAISQDGSAACIVNLGDDTEGFQLKVGKAPNVTVNAPKRPSLLRVRSSGASQMQPCASRAKVLLHHEDCIMGVAFGPDGQSMVAGGEDQTVALWDVGSKARRTEAKMSDPIVAVAYSPSGRYIAAADAQSFLAVWDTVGVEEVGTIPVEGDILTIGMVSKPHEMVAAGTKAKNVLLLCIPELTVIADLRHDGDVRSLSFSPDGSMLAGGGGIKNTHNLMTGTDEQHEMKTVIWRVAPEGNDCKYLGSISFTDVIHATDFSPSGKLLAVGGENCRIAVLLVDQSFDKASELCCVAGVRCLAWSQESRFLASGGEDMQVSVWDVAAESIMFQLPKAHDWICGVAISPDCQWIATCGFYASSVTLHPIEVSGEDGKETASGSCPRISIGGASDPAAPG